MTAADEILLRVPARADYARIVRIGAAALALRQGMTFAEIDDLRLAVDEVMIVLLGGSGDSDEAEIRITYRIDAGRFELEAVRDGAAVAAAAVDRFDELVASLVDDYDIDTERGVVRIRKTRRDEE